MTAIREDTDQAALALEVDGDGVAWLVFDRPDSKVNLLTSLVMARLDSLLGEIEAGVRAGRVRADGAPAELREAEATLAITFHQRGTPMRTNVVHADALRRGEARRATAGNEAWSG